MKTANWIIIIGFIVSGGAFFSAMGLSQVLSQEHWIRENIIPSLLGIGVMLGWLFTVAGLLNVVFGIAFRLSGRLASFWKSLYPVNFGLSILALLMVSYG